MCIEHMAWDPLLSSGVHTPLHHMSPGVPALVLMWPVLEVQLDESSNELHMSALPITD